MTSQQSRNHHVVPQFWLRRFANAQKRLHKYDIMLEHPRPVPVSVKSATVERDFYVLDGLDGRYDIEERVVMQELDAGGSRVIAKLAAATDLRLVWPLEQSDRNLLSAFLSAQVMRTPRFRDHVRQVAEEHLRAENRPITGIDMFRNGVITGEPEVLELVRRYYGVWLEGDDAPPNFHAQFFRDNFNLLNHHLFSFRWMIMKTPVPMFFISDNPLALMRSFPERTYPEFCGVDYRHSRVAVVALTRDLVMVADWHPEHVRNKLHLNGDVIVPYDQRRAEQAWAWLLAHADRHVFVSPEDTYLRSQLEDAAGESAAQPE